MSETTVLMLSMRRLADLVGYCGVYEFEDVMQSVTGADRVDADNMAAQQFSRRIYKTMRVCTGSPALARKLTPAPPAIRLTREYDLFFPTFNHPYELYALASLPDWRKRCRIAACFVSEVWPHLLPSYLFELLAQFDCVFVGCSNALDEVARLTGTRCEYMSPAVDVLNFAPYPELPARTIDVCNIGRRSQSTHQALMTLARANRNFFYYYDTVAASGVDGKQVTFSVSDPREHRRLLASLLRRSRYYIANRARINEPTFIVHGDEISSRFYEGAAAGAVMLGEPPQGKEFKTQFDWPDAVIRVPFEAPQIGKFLEELNKDPERLARIRRNNVYHAALLHDWTYRVRAVYAALGLPPTEKMIARELQLRTVATMAGHDHIPRQDTSIPVADFKLATERIHAIHA